MALLMGFFWESSSGGKWLVKLEDRFNYAESSRSHTVFTCVVESQYTVITGLRTYVLNNCPMNLFIMIYLFFTIEICLLIFFFLTLMCQVFKANHHFCRMWQMVQAALKPAE